MTEFRFAYPWVFTLFIFALLYFVVYFRGWWNTQPSTLTFSDTRLVQDLPTTWRIRFRRLPDILRAFAWVILVFALARPQIGSVREVLRGEGVDIILVLDISSSMALSDYPPNRITAAKSVMSEFIEGREFDRIGLVVFALESFYQAPLTLDYDVLQSLLSEIQLAPEIGLGDKTAIGLGIASAGNMLRASDSDSKIIIVLTDGANNAGSLDPITAAEAVSKFGIRIYTIGIGTTEVELPEGNQTIATLLDANQLESIAEKANGIYFEATNLSDLQNVYNEIDQLEQSEFERQVIIRWQDQVIYWIIASLILLFIERLLRKTIFQTIP